MEAAVLEAPQVLAALGKMTAAEFWTECKVKRAELVNGDVIEKMSVGEAHGYIALNIGSILRSWARANRAGRVYIELGYVLNEHTVRAPDVSFVSSERLTSQQPAPGLFSGAPTLAVEVVSPGDLAGEVEAKVQEYLAAGVPMVWVVYPSVRAVTVRMPGRGRAYGGNETLSGEPVLPGFGVALSEIFE